MMKQIQRDLTTLDSMMLKLRVAELTFECLFSLVFAFGLHFSTMLPSVVYSGQNF